MEAPCDIFWYVEVGISILLWKLPTYSVTGTAYLCVEAGKNAGAHQALCEYGVNM